MKKSILVGPQHFAGEPGGVSMLAGALQFDSCIAHHDRVFWNDIEDGDLRLETARERVTRVIVNPSVPSARVLWRLMKQAHERGQRVPDGEYELSGEEGLDPHAYDTTWGPKKEDEHSEHSAMVEGQRLVAVAYDADERPVGYATFFIHIACDEEGPTKAQAPTIERLPGIEQLPGTELRPAAKEEALRDVYFSVDLEVFYVMPEYRHQAHGFDLATATTLICSDVLHAVYRAVPKGTEIGVVVRADRHTPGGRAISESIAHALDFELDHFFENTSERVRPGVVLNTMVGFEGGT
jgi:GNAT superfamily N-acetyltransferase